MGACDAIAETEMETLPHNEVYVCELKEGHKGPHRVTIEWEGPEWTKLESEPWGKFEEE